MSLTLLSVWRRCLRCAFWGTAALLCFGVPSACALESAVTLTMDDLPFQDVDGLVHPAGVTFGYNGVAASDPDNFANYNSGGPGTTVFIEDPSIEGSTGGSLSLEFIQPTPRLEFGAAVSDAQDVRDGATVELFDIQGNTISTSTLDFLLIEDFAETMFVYVGDPVKSAKIDFFPAFDRAPRFAFDNLTFQVPEPTSFALAALAGVIVLSRRSGARRKCTLP